jgi:acid stress chaperone HdeB
VIVKARLLLTSALFVLVQIPALQAQVTLDLSKITCEQFISENPLPGKYVALWLNGYYSGERHNTIIEAGAIDENERKVDFYWSQHGEMTVMDAAKNVLGSEK